MEKLFVQKCPRNLVVIMSLLNNGDASHSVIVCFACGNQWESSVENSVYMQMDLATQPCPICEAYTLGCIKIDAEHGHKQRSWHMQERDRLAAEIRTNPAS